MSGGRTVITGIEFYSLSKDKIEMHELTKNTIILFNNSDLKNKFVKEFLKINLDETDSVDNSICYSTVSDNALAKEQDHKAELSQVITYLPTTIYLVDYEQRFTFTTEAPFILTCTDPDDLWFCDTNNDGKVQIWAFTAFKRYKEIWDEGLYNVYKTVTEGRCGCYEEYGR